MSEPYPLPAHAVSVWAVDNQLHVAFPATVGEKGHTVPFPLTDKGLLLLHAVLRERASNNLHSLGFKGAPCRHEIERALADDAKMNQWLRSMEMTKAVKAEEKAEADAFLAELGL